MLILPEEELSTKSVYAAYDDVAGGEGAGEFRDRCDALERAWRGLEASWLRGRVRETDVTARVGNIARNDLERAAYRMVPDLFARRLALEATGASLAMMSGSGPTMFALYPSDHGALRATTELQDAGYEAVCTETEMWPAGAGDPCLDAP